MKKNIVLIALFALIASLFTVSAVAQNASAKGACLDPEGKPYVGATVEFTNVDTGRKMTVKTDKRGEFFTMGLSKGNYKVVLTAADGKQIIAFDRMMTSEENVIEIDMKKLQSAAVAGASAEERKKYEAAVKEQSKVKGINQLLIAAGESRKAGDWEKTLEYLTQAGEQDEKKHDVVYGQLADAYMQVKKYPEAEESYKTAITLAPAKGEYHNNLAQVLLKENRVDDAIAEYNKAAEVDPAKAGMYYFNLGAVLTNKGMADQANEAFDKAIAADPTKAEAYYQKAVNLFSKATIDATGKITAPPAVAENLQKYLELAPDGPNAQPAKDLLGSLGTTVQTSFGEQKKAPAKTTPTKTAAPKK